jgi:hypothetical protein
MTLYSYVVARDFGFAPNPFGAACTLATCKPGIRKSAQVGDWVIGTGSATKGLSGRLVYAMHVEQAMTFDEYWDSPEFQNKKPDLRASQKLRFGDNIYRTVDGHWEQADSHHSYPNGQQNERNIKNDTQTNRILTASRFAYWGGQGPSIPGHLRNYHGHDLCIGRGYKSSYPREMEQAFVQWFERLDAQGYLGRPSDWK